MEELHVSVRGFCLHCRKERGLIYGGVMCGGWFSDIFCAMTRDADYRPAAETDDSALPLVKTTDQWLDELGICLIITIAELN